MAAVSLPFDFLVETQWALLIPSHPSSSIYLNTCQNHGRRSWHTQEGQGEKQLVDITYEGESMIWGSWGKILQHCVCGNRREAVPRLGLKRQEEDVVIWTQRQFLYSGCHWLKPNRRHGGPVMQAVWSASQAQSRREKGREWLRMGEWKMRSTGSLQFDLSTFLCALPWISFWSPLYQIVGLLAKRVILVLKDAFFFLPGAHRGRNDWFRKPILGSYINYLAHCSFLLSSLLCQSYKLQLEEEMGNPDSPCQIRVGFSISLKE